MPRFKLTIEYDGGPYVGWQRQTNGPTIQQSLEEAVFKLVNTHVEVAGAGRTDTGVHALAQVAHIDIETEKFDAETVKKALNFHLKPNPIAILKAEKVDETFHARFSAVNRMYRYIIVNRRAPLALDQGRAWFIPQELDAEAMHDAAQVLIGHHDFTTFRATQCQAKSPERTMDRITVTRRQDRIEIEVEARSFLHHQVRNIVGALKWVGEGKWTKADMKNALEAKDRKAGGQTAPSDGLYLVSVGYDEPARSE